MKIQSKMAPDFSSWPISLSFKKLLVNNEEWLDYFSMDPDVLSPILNNLTQQIKEVDFFSSPVDTEQFFEFLRELVESKPKSDPVLKEFSAITVGILDKISLQTKLNTAQAHVVVHYLDLLSLMLEPDYRYLFNNPEISLWTNDFQKISRISFNSPELLSRFRSTLLLSFQSNACIKKYPVLLQTIAELALSVEKPDAGSNELAAMKLFDTLGVLDHTLKTSRIRKIVLNRSAIKLSIQETRNLLYEQFKPFIEENFLQYIVYQSFLSQSYKDSGSNLTQLCESSDYRESCKSDYLRFKDSYHCSPGQFSDFSIVIRNNNLSTLALEKACKAMRNAEFFVTGMKDFGFMPRYNASQYLFHLADSKNDFLIDKLLYERNDPPVKAYTVLATYFQNDATPISTDYLSGKAYSYRRDAVVVVHEYIHHLYALFVHDMEFDLTTTEGIAELFSGGVCSGRNIHDLRNFVNDTTIFDFLRHRKYPFYFNALKWVAYLINEQADLFASLIHLLQEEEKESFYLAIDSFIGNASNREAFVDWSYQHVNTCNEYLRIFPTTHQPAVVYLDSIKQLLNYSKSTMSPQPELISRHIAKRDLLSSHSTFDLNGTELVVYSKKPTLNSEILQITPLSISALIGGFLSANLDHVGEIYQEKCPSLQDYIHYGFKPFVFALVSAGLNNILFDESAEGEEKFARLLTYFAMNFCGVVIGQPIMQTIAENIPNKVLSFFVQSLAWALLWNPSLFISGYSELIPLMWVQVLQGLFFKTGDEAYKLVKKTCHSSSSFWHNKKEQSTLEEPIFVNPLHSQQR